MDIQIYPCIRLLLINSQMKKGRQFKWQNEEEKKVKAKNQKFLFVFDFGDDHQFGIIVKDFGKAQKDKMYPLILESKGKAPGQYPNYDEE